LHCPPRLPRGCLPRPGQIAAQFDPTRCRALYARLAALSAQVWMSGARKRLFSPRQAGLSRARIKGMKSGRFPALAIG
jgi:hypothetical protein